MSNPQPNKQLNRRQSNEQTIQNNPPHHNGSCDVEGYENRAANKK